MSTMYEVGIAKALRGETTIEEVLRDRRTPEPMALSLPRR